MAEPQFQVNINIGPPAPVVVEAPPHMLFLNDPGVYVAVGIPYDVFFFSGHYYYLHGNNWFWGPGYRGPWTYVEYRSLPPGLRNRPIEEKAIAARLVEKMVLPGFASGDLAVPVTAAVAALALVQAVNRLMRRLALVLEQQRRLVSDAKAGQDRS